MHPERWQRIEAICFAALERDPALRAAYLEQACGGDTGLRREVETLLEQHEKHPSFLETPIVSLAGFVGAEPDPLPPSGRIGSYRLIKRLGKGGMGEVYLAVREVDDVRQKVALKLIRRGMDSDEVVRRFRLERRILASLNHPNIAALLDAAVAEDGRPYFVMEHVEGTELDEYCAARRLPVRERLELFQVICRAVQHAHQNLVVHRDLKPRNILVTEDGTPKLLDFGIGKVLSTDAFGDAIETRTELRLLTPEYAAPEQLTGAPVTTATDVYALGVILYELLTGQHPYGPEAADRQDLERIILEVTPPRPSLVRSEIRRQLAGDLDTIVLMALRKEPARRYPSASALAADLQRHLDGLPVTARPDTFGYRAGKFVRRHAGAVSAARGACISPAAAPACCISLSSGR